ncbi:MAG TPA: response regulator [Ktedonobacteraceae bacterium]|nr:response regulator [Ktedonobacteraceae bacterium]
MDEDIFPPFDESQLSPEDLEVLRQFDALEEVSPGPVVSESADLETVTALLSAREEQKATATTEAADQQFLEDMLSVFAFEADEDIAVLRRTLRQIEREDTLDVARFTVLQNVAHKIKGTAGAVGCFAMSTIAYQIEAIARLVIAGTVSQLIGLKALVQAVLTLEVTLDGLIADRVEHSEALEDLQAEYQALGIDVETSSARVPMLPAASSAFMVLPGKRETSLVQQAGRTGEEASFSAPFVRIDTKRFEQLLRHTERMEELQAPLEQAQRQVELALRELQAAQVRLRRLETILTTVTLTSKNSRLERQVLSEELPSSSLVARILHEATERTGHLYQRKGRLRGLIGNGKAVPDSPLWDELEMEQYTENEVLMQQFSEAIADVATASSQLRLAFSRLQELLQAQRIQASSVRSDTLLLRLTPLNALFSRLQRAVMMSAQAQAREIALEIRGETVEIDQDILEELKNPLLQLVRDCVAGSISTGEENVGSDGGKEDMFRVWLHVQALGHEIALELGFSMPVPGGLLDGIQETIRRLHGRLLVQRNTAGGISFLLHLPRSQGTIQGLLVRVGSQQVVVPFSQVQHIDYGRNEGSAADNLCYRLNDLLGFPTSAPQAREGAMGKVETVRPLLALPAQQGYSGPPRLLVEVEEICGSVELVVKPLAEHLQRPGISGAAVDGSGGVLLLLNLPELVRLHRGSGGRNPGAIPSGDEEHRQFKAIRPGQPTILVADDSVYIRQSLLYSLRQTGYRTEEAHDGMEALEKLLELHPDVLVLDIEMPNLNGYDLLSILPAYPEITGVKIIMLTSRSSEKHRARARELGAHAYLTKPCPQEVLVKAINTVLSNGDEPAL